MTKKGLLVREPTKLMGKELDFEEVRREDYHLVGRQGYRQFKACTQIRKHGSRCEKPIKAGKKEITNQTRKFQKAVSSII